MPPKIERGIDPRKVRVSRSYEAEPVEESLRREREYEMKRKEEMENTELGQPDKDEVFISSMKTSFREIQMALDRLTMRIVREERPSDGNCEVERNIDSLTELMKNGPDWIEARTGSILRSIAHINGLIF